MTHPGNKSRVDDKEFLMRTLDTLLKQLEVLDKVIFESCKPKKELTEIACQIDHIQKYEKRIELVDVMGPPKASRESSQVSEEGKKKKRSAEMRQRIQWTHRDTR
ncbi:hypothetical protein JTB14_030892 [Gonioctena quinquepunctata]|nr:hypothetical protein JTB14_030892 [Gonioctena quinquepunctata]